MILAKLQLANGDKEEAIKTGEGHINSHENEVQPLCHWIELLVEADEMDRATKAFETLRNISGSLDLQSPVFTRVSALAADLGCEGEWKKELVIKDDVGQRVELDSLGPFRWSLLLLKNLPCGIIATNVLSAAKNSLESQPWSSFT